MNKRRRPICHYLISQPLKTSNEPAREIVALIAYTYAQEPPKNAYADTFTLTVAGHRPVIVKMTLIGSKVGEYSTQYLC